MRAKEFINEGQGSLAPGVAAALPGAFRIPALQNQDAYLQYRFGVALAGAKGAEQRSKDNVPEYSKESTFGENEIIISYDPETAQNIKDALVQVGLPPNAAEPVGSFKSEELKDTNKISPVTGFKGFKNASK